MKKINFTYLIVFIIWGIIGALSALAVGCGRPHDDISNVNPDPTGQVVPNITDETENNEDNHYNPNLTEVNDTEEEENEENNVNDETQVDTEVDNDEEPPEEPTEEEIEEEPEEEIEEEQEEPENENTNSCFSYIDCPNQEACNVVSSTCFLCTDNWHCNNQFDLQQVGPSFCCTLEDINNQRCDLIGTCQE
jgi:DNA mismatch repair ATPase MutL